eukprot:CAMPEP_0119523594 /NCGR_PEP_ID=MMETSP1344-20130328/38627_1 /TAXON_ID=236787 /ORGANISM="Florenciella parvula, Strain CCMP2471" /LENGTH=276 /DNA_ID=CAMNT_0007561853 /DNA_START=74 /DNA_END=902 /DNA_ORIENTATION=-
MTFVSVTTKIPTWWFLTAGPTTLYFSYPGTPGAAEIKLGSEEDTAGFILAPAGDEAELGRWSVSVDKGKRIASLIVTDKRVAFRHFRKDCGITTIENMESIRADQIQGVKLISSPYVIERFYFGLLLLISGIVVLATKEEGGEDGSSSATTNSTELENRRLDGEEEDSSRDSISYALMAIGVVIAACTLGCNFCKKRDRVVFFLKSPAPIQCFFMNRVIEMEVPPGDGKDAYELVRSQMAKHQIGAEHQIDDPCDLSATSISSSIITTTFISPVCV